MHTTQMKLIFTKKVQLEGFNFYLSNSIAKKYLKPGDEILLTEIEHHANIIPWQMVAKQYQLEIKYIAIDEDFSVDMEDLKRKISNKPKLFQLLVNLIYLDSSLI